MREFQLTPAIEPSLLQMAAHSHGQKRTDKIISSPNKRIGWVVLTRRAVSLQAEIVYSFVNVERKANLVRINASFRGHIRVNGSSRGNCPFPAVSSKKSAVAEIEVAFIVRHRSLYGEGTISLRTAKVLEKTVADGQGLRNSKPAGWKGGDQTAAVF
jgi:hypothetical protein